MNKLRIAILDDNAKHVQKIKIAFDVAKSKQKDLNEYNFEFLELYDELEICESSENAIIYDKIVELIDNNTFDSLIIDNELLDTNKILNGYLLNGSLSKNISNFPVILLTSYENQVMKIDSVDIDKLYSKEKFFITNSEYSSEKVRAILHNATRYKDQLEIYELQYDNLAKKEILTENDECKLVTIEAELSDYKSYYSNPNVFGEIFKRLGDILDEVEGKIND